MPDPFAALDRPLTGKLGTAKWIWGGPEPRVVNSYRLFRRQFTLRAHPQSVHTWCYAEHRFQLWINGRLVQFGPTPCDPHHRLFSRYDITAFLRKGRNCIAFVVHVPGLPTGQWIVVNPALLCWVCEANDRFTLGTDRSWQTCAGAAWRRPTELCGYGKGFSEWHVIADMPAGWTLPGAPDVQDGGDTKARWEAAVELPHYPFGRPEDMRENYAGDPTLAFHGFQSVHSAWLVHPAVTTEMQEFTRDRYTGRMRWERLMGKWHPSCKLAADEPSPPPLMARIGMAKLGPAPPGMVHATGDGGLRVTLPGPDLLHDVAVNLDLGVVRSGLISLEVESTTGGTIDIAGADRIGADGAIIRDYGSQLCDRVELPPGRVQWHSMVERGYRFIQLVLRGFRASGGDITLHRAGILETLTHPATGPAATFESSDELLNRVWRASAETVRLYMNGCGHGDPWRERSAWFGDSYLAGRMAFYCFQDWRLLRRALELTAQSQRTDGCFPVVSPGVYEDFNMVLGSCAWVTRLVEYLDLTGDARFARRMLPHVQRHIDYELRYADGRGLLYETLGRRFLCWADGEPSPPYKPGETYAKTGRKPWGDFFDPPTRGFNAIINIAWLACLRAASALAGRLGQRRLAAAWEDLFPSARRAFDETFWVPQTGLYRDNLAFDFEGRSNSPTYCEATLFTMISADLIDAEKATACLARIWDPRFICCRSSAGLELSVVPIFLLQTGRTAEALALWKDRWGYPVLDGATTSGEEFFRIPANSDCHIHGAAPARDFIEHLAGIRFTGPLWSEVTFAPPADGPDLTCTVPTPRGPVSVGIRTGADGGRWFSYRVPQGCRARWRSRKRQVLLKEEGELRLPTRSRS